MRPLTENFNSPDSHDFERFMRITRRSGHQIYGHSPFRDDKNPSFSANRVTGLWTDFGTGESGNWDQFMEKMGITSHEPIQVRVEKTNDKTDVFWNGAKEVATYEYLNEKNQQTLRVIRYENPKIRTKHGKSEKKFVQKKLVNGRWVTGKPKELVAPYRYVNWRNHDGPIFFVEGEKCVEALEARGLVATTTPGGSNLWRSNYSKYFSNKTVFILEDNDSVGKKFAKSVHSDLQDVAKDAKLVSLCALSEGEDIVEWFQNGGTPEELLKICSNAPKETVQESSVYPVIGNRTYFRKGNDENVYLANFNAQIVKEEIRDDGIGKHRQFVVEGRHQDGSSFPRIEIPAERFNSLSWVSSQWGAKASIAAGMNAKDRLREAIQHHSAIEKVEQVFGHTGWRMVNGSYLFLHAGGGIGSNGLTTDVRVVLSHPRLNNVLLPKPPTDSDLQISVRASLQFLKLGKPSIVTPLFAGIYSAPLGEAIELDYSIFIEGTSGSLKTSLTGCQQSHFGQWFDEKHLPESWESTANALEWAACIAKDIIHTVDDFCPKGNYRTVQDLHQKADRLFRGAGNRQGRSRLQQDGQASNSYFPRCLILTSGEDYPRGQSLNARLVRVSIGKDDIDRKILSEIQYYGREGLLASAMSGFIQWLAPKMSDLKKELSETRRSLRSLAHEKYPSHLRTPNNVAALGVALKLFYEFAAEVGAIPKEEWQSTWEASWNSLLESSKSLATEIGCEDESERALEILATCLKTGSGHLVRADMSGAPPSDATSFGWAFDQVGGCSPKGLHLGWVTDDEILLEPNGAFRAIQRFAAEQRREITLNQTSIWKRWAEKGYILLSEENRNQVRRVIGTNRPYVIAFSLYGIWARRFGKGETNETNELSGSNDSGDSQIIQTTPQGASVNE